MASNVPLSTAKSKRSSSKVIDVASIVCLTNREAKKRPTSFEANPKGLRIFLGETWRCPREKTSNYQMSPGIKDIKYKRVNLTKRIGSSVKKWNGKQKMTSRVDSQWSLGSCPRRWKRVALKIEVSYPPSIWVFPKIVGFPPKSSILIGFSIFQTIHFGGFPPIFGNPQYIEKKYREKYEKITMSGLTHETLWSLLSHLHATQKTPIIRRRNFPEKRPHDESLLWENHGKPLNWRPQRSNGVGQNFLAPMVVEQQRNWFGHSPSSSQWTDTHSNSLFLRHLSTVFFV